MPNPDFNTEQPPQDELFKSGFSWGFIAGIVLMLVVYFVSR